MSCCSVLALLVPTKDGTVKIHVDSCAIKKIIVKYRYLIPRPDVMVDEFHGAEVFYRIDLRGGYQ